SYRLLLETALEGSARGRRYRQRKIQMKRLGSMALPLVASPTRVVALALLATALVSQPVSAQRLPGGSTVKDCLPPGPLAVGTDFTCNITFTNKDTFNDTLTFTDIEDQVRVVNGVPQETVDLPSLGPLGPGTTVLGGCFTGDASVPNFLFIPD